MYYVVLNDVKHPGDIFTEGGSLRVFLGPVRIVGVLHEAFHEIVFDQWVSCSGISSSCQFILNNLATPMLAIENTPMSYKYRVWASHVVKYAPSGNTEVVFLSRVPGSSCPT